MMNDEDDMYASYGMDGVEEESMIDIDSAIPLYDDGTSSEFIDDERDFEDVDDLDELLAEDKEAEALISEDEKIPEEDLLDDPDEAESTEVVEYEGDDEDEEEYPDVDFEEYTDLD